MDNENIYTRIAETYTPERIREMWNLANIENLHDPAVVAVEYQDFMEEWRYNKARMLREIEAHFIWNVLVANKARFQCSNHVHTFLSNEESEQAHEYANPVLIDPAQPIVEDSCWINCFRRKVKRSESISFESLSKHSKTFQFYLSKVVDLRLREKYLISAEMSLALYEKLVAFGLSAKNDSEEEIIKTCVPDIEYRVMRDSFLNVDHSPVYDDYSVVSDHNLHKLLYNTGDWSIVKVISKIRNDKANNITKRVVRAAMMECSSCNNMTTRFPLSELGIYYSPPGNGKTTAIKFGHFVGFDTDWLVTGLRYSDVLPILRKKIPILTNQYMICQGAGVPCVGFVNSTKLRSNEEHGYPLTPLSEIKIMEKILGNDITLLYDEEHMLSEMMAVLFLMVHIKHSSLMMGLLGNYGKFIFKRKMSIDLPVIDVSDHDISIFRKLDRDRRLRLLIQEKMRTKFSKVVN